MVSGIVIRIVLLAFIDFRNMIATIMASNKPIQRLSVTLFTESCTKPACI